MRTKATTVSDQASIMKVLRTFTNTIIRSITI
jgi:hypothetical protein